MQKASGEGCVDLEDWVDPHRVRVDYVPTGFVWDSEFSCATVFQDLDPLGLAQKKGTVKDVQGLRRHSRVATTTDVYMQEIPESLRATVNAIYRELRVKPENLAAN
jgi:hypothetical protein